MRNNLKYLIITVVGGIILFFNISTILKIVSGNTQTDRTVIYRKQRNPIEFYKTEFPKIEISRGSERRYLPNNKNILIIAINNDYRNHQEMFSAWVKNKDVSEFYVDILFITSNENIINDGFYFYDSYVLHEHLSISDNIDFCVLVDKNNLIEFFSYTLPSFFEIDLLLRKYKKR